MRGRALPSGRSQNFIKTLWNEVSGSAKVENSMTIDNSLQTKPVCMKP